MRPQHNTAAGYFQSIRQQSGWTFLGWTQRQSFCSYFRYSWHKYGSGSQYNNDFGYYSALEHANSSWTTTLKSLAFVGSSILQSVYVVSLASNFITFQRADLSALYDSGDPEMLAGFISFLSLRLFLGAAIGLIGVLIAWIAIRRSSSPPSWFVTASGWFGLAWVVFFPVGTVIAAFMLQWRYNVRRSQEEISH